MRLSAFALALILFLTSCVHTLCGSSLELTLLTIRPAIVRLDNVVGSCTAFHIGDGQFLSAAHCDSGYPITLIDHHGKQHQATIVSISKEKDLLLLAAKSFEGPALDIWSDDWQGDLLPGERIVSVGFPGYYHMKYTFEHGYVKDIINYKDSVEYTTAKDMAYPGESGGPVISLRTGKVIGVVSALSERILFFNDRDHQHASISLFVSHHEIRKFLSERK
jgi:hypothetical protein